MYPSPHYEEEDGTARGCQRLEASSGLGARKDGMRKGTERLINTVSDSEPKMLKGLNQKVCGGVDAYEDGITQRKTPPVDRTTLTHPMWPPRNVVSPTGSAYSGREFARTTDG